MNRYHGANRGSTIGGPSKASASTTCQKCLKKDSYECKANAQERPYVPRPSRTQQLLNPKLLPKLTSDVPHDLLRKKGIADEQLAKAKEERGRKHERQDEDSETGASKPKRQRSLSSTPSVSTISTSRSRSRSPPPQSRQANHRSGSYISEPTRRSQSPPRPRSGRYAPDSPSRSRSLSRNRTLQDSERKRRRASHSSVESYSSTEGYELNGDGRSTERASSRSTRRRFTNRSPDPRGRRRISKSRSPDRGRRRLSNDRRRFDDAPSTADPRREAFISAGPPPQQKERSLSPFSKRLALTQAMNMGR